MATYLLCIPGPFAPHSAICSSCWAQPAMIDRALQNAKDTVAAELNIDSPNSVGLFEKTDAAHLSCLFCGFKLPQDGPPVPVALLGVRRRAVDLRIVARATWDGIVLIDPAVTDAEAVKAVEEFVAFATYDPVDRNDLTWEIDDTQIFKPHHRGKERAKLVIGRTAGTVRVAWVADDQWPGEVLRRMTSSSWAEPQPPISMGTSEHRHVSDRPSWDSIPKTPDKGVAVVSHELSWGLKKLCMDACREAAIGTEPTLDTLLRQEGRIAVGVAHELAGVAQRLGCDTKLRGLLTDDDWTRDTGMGRDVKPTASMTGRTPSEPELQNIPPPKPEEVVRFKPPPRAGIGKYGSAHTFADKLRTGEPWFGIRAQDKYAVAAVRGYAQLLAGDGRFEQAMDVRALADDIEKWQAANPSLVKTPD